jgi:hypothetical protein
MEAFNTARGRYHTEVASGLGDHQGVDIPWLRERGLMPDSNGLQANRPAIRYLIQACYAQGMSKTLYEPEDLFVSA